VAAVDSARLGAILREHDVYVTASRHDPCSNALLEALSCGLPALYLDSGGHRELVGEGGLPFTDQPDLPEQLDRLVDAYETRQALIRVPSIGDVATRYLAVMNVEGIG
jgi:glycosyltransferase involved in cell wall biosynthesis